MIKRFVFKQSFFTCGQRILNSDSDRFHVFCDEPDRTKRALACYCKAVPGKYALLDNRAYCIRICINHCYVFFRLCNGPFMFKLDGDVGQRIRLLFIYTSIHLSHLLVKITAFQRRSKMLREVGMFQEGGHIFFDNNFGKTTTTEATTAVTES